jgi:maltooligosyltrehalose trehalohydrolase
MLRSPERGGFGMDMVWNDDFHHSAMVRATGRNEAYYTDYLGRAREFVAAIEWGYLYQGQRYKWQQKRRGSPVLDQPAHVFVNYLQNHDQLANSGRGQRLHELTSPGKLRALTATLLLGPGTPLLFQGQEFASSSPFLYFADPGPDLAPSVTKGRLKFLSQFPSLALPELQRSIPEPSDSATFARCRLNFAERHTNGQTYRLHADLLRLRRNDVCLRPQDKRSLAAAVINDDCFLVRYFSTDPQHLNATQRLLVVNFGRELHLDPAPEPLLAPPEDRSWSVLWSSEDLCYGGLGTPALETDDNWRIPAECAVLMQPVQSNDLEPRGLSSRAL